MGDTLPLAWCLPDRWSAVDQESVLAEVKSDLKWIGKNIDGVGDAVKDVESRLSQKITTEVAAIDKVTDAIEVRLKACEAKAQEAADRATHARDSGSRLLWAVLGILGVNLTLVGFLLITVYEMVSAIKK